MTVKLSEETRVDQIIGVIEDLQDEIPGTLLTHTFIQSVVERRYRISGTLVRKYIRHALVRGYLSELRPSYDGSIGAVEIVTGNSVYISPVKSEVRYALVPGPTGTDHSRQLALVGTPECVRNVLEPFTQPEILRHHDCG